jgi:hypothetical protein
MFVFLPPRSGAGSLLKAKPEVPVLSAMKVLLPPSELNNTSSPPPGQLTTPTHSAVSLPASIPHGILYITHNVPIYGASRGAKSSSATTCYSKVFRAESIFPGKKRIRRGS